MTQKDKIVPSSYHLSTSFTWTHPTARSHAPKKQQAHRFVSKDDFLHINPTTMRGKTENKKILIDREVIKSDGDDEESVFSTCSESTAKGMFSWSGLHFASCGGCVLYIMARRTAETVGMNVVLFRASSHVSPISWQSLVNILLVRSPSSSSCVWVPFLPSPFNYRRKIKQIK